LKELPDLVQDGIGFALFNAQKGEKHADAKPLSGFGGAGVLEIVEEITTAIPSGPSTRCDSRERSTRSISCRKSSGTA
jgi:hypothetical protein